MSETLPTGESNPFEWEADDGEVEAPEHIEEGAAYIEALASGFDAQTIRSNATWAGVSTSDAASSDSSTPGVPTSREEFLVQWFALEDGEKAAVVGFTAVGLAALLFVLTEEVGG